MIAWRGINYRISALLALGLLCACVQAPVAQPPLPITTEGVEPAYLLMQILPDRIHVHLTPEEDKALVKATVELAIPKTSSATVSWVEGAHYTPEDNNTDVRLGAFMKSMHAQTLAMPLKRVLEIETQLKNALPESSLRPFLFNVFQRELGRGEIPIHSSHLAAALTKKEIFEAIRSVPEEIIVAVVLNYVLTPDSRTLHMYAEATIYRKSQGQMAPPVGRGEFIYQSEAISEQPYGAAIELWSAHQGEHLRSALEEGVGRIVAMLGEYLLGQKSSTASAGGAARVRVPLVSLSSGRPVTIAGMAGGEKEGWLMFKANNNRYFALPRKSSAAQMAP